MRNELRYFVFGLRQLRHASLARRTRIQKGRETRRSLCKRRIRREPEIEREWNRACPERNCNRYKCNPASLALAPTFERGSQQTHSQRRSRRLKAAGAASVHINTQLGSFNNLRINNVPKLDRIDAGTSVATGSSLRWRGIYPGKNCGFCARLKRASRVGTHRGESVALAPLMSSSQRRSCYLRSCQCLAETDRSKLTGFAAATVPWALRKWVSPQAFNPPAAAWRNTRPF